MILQCLECGQITGEGVALLIIKKNDELILSLTLEVVDANLTLYVFGRMVIAFGLTVAKQLNDAFG